jgi:hypothetical protein
MKRIYHTWDKWECYPAGFYDNGKPGQKADDCEQRYADFLRDDTRFRVALLQVLAHWPRSCEHYLTNENMNRIAWLGQASACISLGLPSIYRGGFGRLTEAEQQRANATALEALNKWLTERGEQELTMDEAQPKTKADLY